MDTSDGQIPYRVLSIDAARRGRCDARVSARFGDSVVMADGGRVGTRSSNGHDQGCYDGHVAILKDIIESGEEGAFVFEDDVYFPPNRQNISRWPTAHSLLAEAGFSPGSGFLYLGHRLTPARDLEYAAFASAHLLAGVRTLDAHAYYIGRLAAISFVQNYESYAGVPIDVRFAESLIFPLCVDTRALYPMIAIQDGINGVLEKAFEAVSVTPDPLTKNLQRRVTLTMVIVTAIAVVVVVVLHIRNA